MKFTCDRNDLSACVSMVVKAVPKETGKGILECILIEAKQGEIHFTTNDTEFGIHTTMEGEIEKEGKVAIDARRLEEVVRHLKADIVTFDCDDTLAKIIAGKRENKIPCRSGDDYAYLPEIEKKNSVVISQFILKELVNKTIFSIGMTDSNKILSGLHFVINNNKLKVTGLDGHRISIRESALDGEFANQDVIVPGKMLNEVTRIIKGGAEDMINIFFSDNFIIFEFDRTTVVSRLIDGKYFDVDKMITTDFETKVKVNKRALLDAIDGSMVYSKEGNKKPIVFTLAGDNLHLEVRSQLGDFDEDVEVSHEGPDIRIGFNPKFVLDVLKNVDEEEIFLYFINTRAPLYIRDEENTYTYMVLPVSF